MEKKSKRDLMLEAAFKLFIKQGYKDTKIIEIADSAGVGKGTVYEYFPSKEFLFSQVFKEKILAEYKKIESLLLEKETAEEKIVTFVQFEYANSKKFGDTLQMLPEMIMNTSALKNKGLQNILSLLWEYRFNTMHSIILEGIKNKEFTALNSEMMAISVMGSINFYILYEFDMMPKDWPKIVGNSNWEFEDFIEIILSGIREKTK
jgi:TetR/AcrR family fatty acid metabolism transcriptional regulator